MPATARTSPRSPAEVRADAPLRGGNIDYVDVVAQIGEAEMAALASALARLLISAAKNGGKPQPAGPPYRGTPAGAPRRVVPRALAPTKSTARG